MELIVLLPLDAFQVMAGPGSSSSDSDLPRNSGRRYNITVSIGNRWVSCGWGKIGV